MLNLIHYAVSSFGCGCIDVVLSHSSSLILKQKPMGCVSAMNHTPFLIELIMIGCILEGYVIGQIGKERSGVGGAEGVEVV